MGDFILRGWNWCRRFRHRCGYGVHSPSDFFFITFVIYERLPFYAYAPLHHLRRVVAFLPHYREKVDKFLFRLINHLRPSVVWEVGTGSGISTRYMAEANAGMQVYTFSEQSEDAVKRILSGKSSIDYLTGNCEADMDRLLKEGVKPEVVHIAHTPVYKEMFSQKVLHCDKEYKYHIRRYTHQSPKSGSLHWQVNILVLSLVILMLLQRRKGGGRKL